MRLAALLQTKPPYIYILDIYSKRKKNCSHGSKFFPCRVDPFSLGRQLHFERVVNHESYPFYFKRERCVIHISLLFRSQMWAFTVC